MAEWTGLVLTEVRREDGWEVGYFEEATERLKKTGRGLNREEAYKVAVQEMHRYFDVRTTMLQVENRMHCLGFKETAEQLNKAYEALKEVYEVFKSESADVSESVDV